MIQKSKRLLSLDVMRGLTIALMIVVNNQVGSGAMYPFLNHVLWDGLSFADLVFPSFMFIMGVSAVFSLSRLSKTEATKKILWRGIKIILAGWILTWLGRILKDPTSFQDLAHLRLTGVLVRLGICYIGAGLIYVWLPTRQIRITFIVAILAIYTVILFLFNGFELSENNIISVVDRCLIGPDHMYHKKVGDIRINFDPEGLLSNLPGIAHVMIGMIIGEVIRTGKKNLWETTARLALTGSGLMILGFLLNPMLPINKNLWTPSYVFATCGGACSLLGILLWYLDLGKRKAKFLTGPACVFGTNPLALYCFSYLLEECIWDFKIGGIPFPEWTSGIFGGGEFGSLCYSLVLVAICMGVGYPLYRKKIVIKL